MNLHHRTPSAAKGIFIANSWRPAASGRTLDVIAPADGKVFARIAAGGADDVDAAVKAARQAAENGPWCRLTATERGRLLSKLAVAITDHATELAALEACDTGKPMKQAKADIVAAARYFEFYGGAADKLHGETIPFLNGYFVPTERVPFGVTGHIIPWNYPAQMFARTLAPSLAMGNAVVIKPAEDACLTPLRLTELAAECGFPEGAINVVPGLGEEAGEALADHPDIDFIAFTGSPEVGTLIQIAAAKNHIGCTLELGGKSPHVMFADADYETAIPVIANTIVQNAGQTCSAGSRLLVEQRAYDEVVARVEKNFVRCEPGHLKWISILARLSMQSKKIASGTFFTPRRRGRDPRLGRRRCGGRRFQRRFLYRATIHGTIPADQYSLAMQEVFGPVLSVLPFTDEATPSVSPTARVRPDRCHLVVQRLACVACRAPSQGRASLYQRLWRRRRYRAPLRRDEKIWPWTRKRL